MENPTISKGVLFEDCVVGDVDSLKKLLQNPGYVAKALETEEFVDDEEHGFTHPRLNLDVMLEQACRAGSTDVVRCLLSFAKEHEVPYKELIRRDSICGAIGSDSALAVFKELHAALPDVIDMDMGLVGTPLGQAIGGSNSLPLYTGERAPLVQFLLEHGADPNRMIHPTGTYLQNAVIRASVEIIELLLQHGAKIAQSGAMHEAAERGRLDVMNILLEHGADVNEQFAGDLSFSASYRARKKKEKGIISDITDDLCNRGRKTKEYVVTSDVPDYGKQEWNHETPLHYSVLAGQVDATKWLVLHGADASVKDSKGWSARDMATKIGNAGLLEALGLKATSTTD
jgi:ankyrin repeat protein